MVVDNFLIIGNKFKIPNIAIMVKCDSGKIKSLLDDQPPN